MIRMGLGEKTASRNNTDGNKLVIFSGIALYYGDNYIVLNATSHLAKSTSSKYPGLVLQETA